VIEPGSEEAGDVLQVLPTFHPAFVARSRRWRPIFVADLGRAFRLFSNKLRWTDPEFHYQPTADQLYRWLCEARIDGERPAFWTFDYETTIADPLTNEMLCLGIGLRDEGYCIGLRSCEEGRRLEPLYEPAEEKRVREVIRWFFTSADHVKVAHNAYFDNQVTRHHFGVDSTLPRHILIHRSETARESFHCIHTDVTSWKNDHDGRRWRQRTASTSYNISAAS
jgi:hypothetical protein